MFFWVLKALVEQRGGGPEEAGRWDDGEVDRGGRGLGRGGCCVQVDGYLRPLTLPPPLTTFYGRNKQHQTPCSHHHLLRPLVYPVV